MNFSETRKISFPFTLLLSWLIAGCSLAPWRHEALDHFPAEQRAVTQQIGAIRVRTAVPGRDEAEKIFGIPVYDRGIQPVWLEIRNVGDVRARLIISSIDDEYFTPFEVAYKFRRRFSRQGWQDLEKYLHENAMPRQIGPHETVSGFVFTHAVTGTKAFNVEVFRADENHDYEQFTFFIDVPGFVPDHAEVDFAGIYSADAIQDVGGFGLRARINEMTCCTNNRGGNSQGRPVNLFFVAKGRDLLRALLRAGWAETSYKRDEGYLAATDYLFARPPDAIFRKGRDKSTERIELALWLAPVVTDGKPLWAGQVKHAIGRRYEIGEMFLGVKLDPDVTDGRNFVLQDLWYAQSLKHWAWLDSAAAVPKETPEFDFSGNPWFNEDGYRVVIWVSGEPIALQDAAQLDWGALENGSDVSQ